MQQAIPYKSSWQQTMTTPNSLNDALPMTTSWNHRSSRNDVVVSVSESAAIVFSRKGCCMSHVVKRLLLGLGANPAVYEIDEEEEMDVIKELEGIGEEGNGQSSGKVQLPAVFIGGRLFGGLDRVMATHISGDLIPILKQAGALWL